MLMSAMGSDKRDQQETINSQKIEIRQLTKKCDEQHTQLKSREDGFTKIDEAEQSIQTDDALSKCKIDLNILNPSVYIKSLETDIALLRSANNDMTTENVNLQKDIKTLKQSIDSNNIDTKKADNAEIDKLKFARNKARELLIQKDSELAKLKKAIKELESATVSD